jgi:hypothetical protein
VLADPSPLGPLQEWELPALRRYAAQLWQSPLWRAQMQKEIVQSLRHCMRSATNRHRPPEFRPPGELPPD